MKNNIFTTVVLISLISVILFSCVPARQMEDMKAKKDQCESENSKLKTDNEKLTTSNTELTSKLADINKRFYGLQNDTMVLGTSLRRVTVNYDQLDKTYELLLQKNKELLAGNVTETQKISSELQVTQESLLKKEDELTKLAKELNDKKANLDITTAQLKEKEKKIAELQSVLNKKDSTVKALKDKVSEALNSYMNNGLTVVQKNGKVYVSLDEKLLFASGSFAVDPKGQEALKKLGKVLDANTDINIMIEGHTDNVPYSGNGQIKDNWDLSVMRATTIVKILLKNSTIDASRLTAAGRGEFFPVDVNSTKEGRAKNRRTEIILTPKMDELFKVLETN